VSSAMKGGLENGKREGEILSPYLKKEGGPGLGQRNVRSLALLQNRRWPWDCQILLGTIV
jgi:hypothetical protein